MAHPDGMYTDWVGEHFADSPKAYRAMPFWEWNCKRSPSVITCQIKIFHRMGMGGFYMHPRIGLDTPYLGDEFMECIQASVEKARELGLYASIYDDDRWPSGTAGGEATSNKAFLARRLWFSPDKRTSGTYKAAYRVYLDQNGFLKSYERIDQEADKNLNGWFTYEDVVGGWDGHMPGKQAQRDQQHRFHDLGKISAEAPPSPLPGVKGALTHNLHTGHPQPAVCV